MANGDVIIRESTVSSSAFPILFLDIDGVLIPQPECGWREDLDAGCVERILHITRETGARIVLSSLWRHSKQKRRILEASGLSIFSITPVIGGEPRATEIMAWLQDAQSHGVSVSDYVILDDGDDADIEGHFFKIDSRHGITDAIADLVIARFGRSTIQNTQ
ncbi:MAG: HAD domain-containing protein [Armatimonas sp.]